MLEEGFPEVEVALGNYGGSIVLPDKGTAGTCHLGELVAVLNEP